MRTKLLFVLVTLVTLVATASATAQFPQLRTAREEFRDAAEYRRQLVGDTPMIGPDGAIILGVRCATHGLTAAEHAAANARAAEFRPTTARGDANDPVLNAGTVEAQGTTKNNINVVVHVLHDGDIGNVSRADIKAQMRVLRRAFKRHGFRFKLKEVTRTDNSEWFNGCLDGQVLKRSTSALAVRPKRNLNVYLCNPGAGFLGFATLAGSSTANTKRDGVFVLYSTLPNGTTAPYNLGQTMTHEIGHYLGLLHTFEGGCGGLGDFVDDTADEATPTFGCPTGKDTCAEEGLDPINNFMDYTDDACMTEFTRGQRDRMAAQVEAHRRRL
jgi:hypothetical protein